MGKEWEVKVILRISHRIRDSFIRWADLVSLGSPSKGSDGIYRLPFIDSNSVIDQYSFRGESSKRDQSECGKEYRQNDLRESSDLEQ
jgi:hypothetical protein